MGGYSPWADIAGSSIAVVYEPLDGIDGLYDPDTGEIVLDPRLTQAQRRSTLCHEWVHRERGHSRDALRCDVGAPREGRELRRNESRAEQTAAHLLIPLDRLADALSWAHDHAEAADELWVDEAMLRTRLDHLHPSERAYLHRTLNPEREA